MFNLFKKKNYKTFNVMYTDLSNKWTYKFKTLEFFTTHLTIYNVKGFRTRYSISRMIDYIDIKSMDYVQEIEEKQVNKSLIGRSLIGGALLGGTGVLVGALSCLTPSTKKKTYYSIVIELKNGEVLKFHDVNLNHFGFFKRMANAYLNHMEEIRKANEEMQNIFDTIENKSIENNREV